MKQKYFFAICGVLWGIQPVAAALTLCQDSITCANSLLCSDFCCPDGTTGTSTSCPSGWTYVFSSGECERVSVDAGEDDKGYLQTQYGTCAQTTSTHNCYVPSSSETVTIDGSLYRCVSCTGGSLWQNLFIPFLLWYAYIVGHLPTASVQRFIHHANRDIIWTRETVFVALRRTVHTAQPLIKILAI